MFSEFKRAAWVEVSLGNIRDNYRAIRQLAPECGTIACVKGDAYGHGIVNTSLELAGEGAEYLGVATLGEAEALRGAGIRTKIVLLSPFPRANAKDVIDLDLIPVVTTYTDAELLSQTAAGDGSPKKICCFIALETGMGRLGFMPTDESVWDISAIASLPGIKILGLHSHFASADGPDLSFAKKQLKDFNIFAEKLRETGIDTGKKSMANSAAIMTLPESHFDIVRPGIAQYGIYPSDAIDKNAVSLKPAMSVKANIIYVKKTPPGASVSYGSTFVTERESLIATLPVGYADGMPRNTHGEARVLVRGRYAPIVGTVCMDLCMADVTDIPGIREYDEAVLLGEQGSQTILAEEIAVFSDTNPYEVVTRFGQRLPRKYI